MAKAVLISIRPGWVEKILSGKKTLEVRKNRPCLETPFKCYIYCTNNGGCLANRDACLNGKVVAEFVCDPFFQYNSSVMPQMPLVPVSRSPVLALQTGKSWNTLEMESEGLLGTFLI